MVTTNIGWILQNRLNLVGALHIKFVAGPPTLDFVCIMTQIKLHSTHL